MKQFHVSHDGTQSGPYAEAQARSLFAQGSITANDLVWCDGMSAWQAAANVFGVARASAGAAPHPRPHPAQTSMPPDAIQDLAALAADKVTAASKDALQTFKMFASNPVAGLSVAFESLGQARALAVGITFGALFALCVLFAVYGLYAPFLEWRGLNGFSGFAKILGVAFVPFISLFGASFLGRAAFRGEGGVTADSLIAGSSLLPLGFVALLARVLGLGNIEVIAVFALFAGCLLILMLFAGLTRICKISEQSATLAIPLMLIATGWLSKIIFTAWLM